MMGHDGTHACSGRMGVAARALLAGEKVVWIGSSVYCLLGLALLSCLCELCSNCEGLLDTAGPVCRTRFRDILRYQIRQQKRGQASSSQTSNKTTRRLSDDALTRILHFHARSLAHLMALISSPPPGFPPQNTGLLVIDNISTLFNSEFKSELPSSTRQQHAPPPPPNSTRHQYHSLAERECQDKLRWKLVASLLSSLRKLALRLDSGVLAINEMGSRFRPGQRPMLHQALSGVTWERGVAARIVLYFASVPARLRERLRGMSRVRIAEVLKVAGRSYGVRAGERVVPYLLLEVGFFSFFLPLKF